MFTSRVVDNETVVGGNSRFAEVSEDDILRMQDNKKEFKESYEIRNESFQR